MSCLRDAQIDEKPTATKNVTARFNASGEERTDDFLDKLHSRCTWRWALSPAELFAGHPDSPATAREIALWIQP